jgi:beta-lactamase regulating signal transducer with metallopeptidase domain
MGFIVSFLFYWSLEITVLVFLTACLCRALKKQSGNIHAAMWTTTLCIIWLLPLAPMVIPDSIVPAMVAPVIVQSSTINLKTGVASESILPTHSNKNRRVAPSLPILQQNSQSPKDKKQINKQPEDSKSLLAASTHNISDMLMAFMVILWCIGVGISFYRWIRCHLSVRRLLAASQTIKDQEVIEAVERTRQILFINGNIQIRTADVQTAPFVMGFLKPLIFIPQYMLDQWNPRDRQAVVAHELAHLRRYDLAAHHAMRLLRIVLWFLPPVLWMQRVLHRTQDAACDECAAVVMGSGPEFGRALTQMAESCFIDDPVFPALGLLHSKSSLIIRLENIMNSRITQLSRLSLKFKFALTGFACMMFLLSGMVKPAISQQSLTVDFLGNFSGEMNSIKIESIVYAAPYYAVIGRQNDARIIHYYKYQDKQLVQEFTNWIDASTGDEPSARLIKAVANESYIVLFYKTDNGLWLMAFDHDKSQTFGVTMKLSGISKIKAARLDGADLYFIDEMQNSTLYRYTLGQEFLTSNQWQASIPEDISTTDFELINGEIFLSDGYGDDEAGNMLGVARCWIDANGELHIDELRRYADDGHPFTDKIMSMGTTAFITRSSYGFFYHDVLIVDWSAKDNPVVIDTIKANRVDYMANNGTILAVPARPEQMMIPKAGTDLYQSTDGQWNKIVNLPDANGVLACGPEVLLSYDGNDLKAYDITEPANPSEISMGVTSALRVIHIASEGFFVHATADTDFISIDTAIPSSSRINNITAIPENEYASIKANDSILSYSLSDYANEGPNSLTLYEILEDGSLGEEIPQPPIPSNITYSALANLFNDHFYIQAYYIPQPDGMSFPDPAYPELYIHARSGNKIDAQPLSTITLMVDSSFLRLSGNLLFELRREYVRKPDPEIGSLFIEYQLFTYSLENAARPVLLSKFMLPISPDFNRPSGPYIHTVVPNGDYYVYCCGRSPSGILDVSDPENPRHIGHLPSAYSIFWYKGLLGLGQRDAIIFFRIDPEQGPIEIARIEQNLLRDVSISGDRMTVSKLDKGIDIYQLSLDQTGILNWRLH